MVVGHGICLREDLGDGTRYIYRREQRVSNISVALKIE